MIGIEQYRSIIGQYCPKPRSSKYLYRNRGSFLKVNNRGRWVFNVVQAFLKIVILITSTSVQAPTSTVWSTSTRSPTSTAWCSVPYFCCTVPSYVTLHSWSLDNKELLRSMGVNTQTGNFWAKYKYGNRTKIKGIKNMHLNIRKIRYKVSEIKNIIKKEAPDIFGLSECDLKKEGFDTNNLKIPGYEVLFPKSWNVYGFARVLVYIKKTLNYEQVLDLEHDQIQSVWIRGGFKSGKNIYFCHAYREHSSVMGDSLNSQKEYLHIFVRQWEDATLHNFPLEPNEVHISLDMNLDYLKEKWLQPTYRLCSLTRLVENVCNANNFTQLVVEPTRSMYNSVTNTTEISCIDHVYCNARHKCSRPEILSCGTSDHDIVSYVRYSKAPASPARTIRRRSYKEFVEEDLLSDIAGVDWTDVYTSNDVDTATEIFTRKFRYVLNVHAP